MNHLENQVVLSEEDFDLLTKYVKPTDNKENEMSLAYELGRATVLKKLDVPKDRVRIDARIKIQDVDSTLITALTLVAPENANIKEQKISVITPIGSALIGFKKGDRVEWKMPSGIKRYVILEVD
ncbi:GreA/GreB family elongation factor [Olivibacter domesticus]|uniref:Regulator of nucleoside diphosphate kinase n=1 Tax=Olivibacter domesticus TaxID=407022 RepID=A0A1H7XFF1_OLID1|nr:GreA/GreB family elongation factor [Olivibacter domesticus]SEM32622.1 regulator of nucleoside diphosphate kinase [Olivibacter domesticus]